MLARARALLWGRAAAEPVWSRPRTPRARRRRQKDSELSSAYILIDLGAVGPNDGYVHVSGGGGGGGADTGADETSGSSPRSLFTPGTKPRRASRV